MDITRAILEDLQNLIESKEENISIKKEMLYKGII